MVIKSAQSSVMSAMVTATIASIVIMMTAMYILWSFFAVPNNSQAFSDGVSTNLNAYRERVVSYMTKLDQQASDSISNIAFSEFSSDLSVVSESLKADLESGNVSVQSVSVFSVDKIDDYLGAEFLSEDEAKKPVSFLTIDMLNRLQSNEKIYWEAARETKETPWHLNKIFPIRDDLNKLVGAVRIKLSLNGLRQVFSEEDKSVGSIRVSQSINHEAPIYFFNVGHARSFGVSKTTSIENSYWDIQYQPSLSFKESYNKIPEWLWSVAAGLFLLLALATMLVARKAKSEAIKLERKPERKTEKAKAEKTKTKKEPSPKPASSDKEKVVQEEQERKQGTPRLEIAPEIFRAYDIRGIVDEQLSDEVFYSLGQAVASEAMDAGEESIIVGHDSRTHSPEFAICFIEGVISTGCHAVDIGLVPTPLLNFSAIHHPETSSGVIITASHNPANYNGCKIVIKGNTLVEEDIQRLKQRILDDDLRRAGIKGAKTSDDYSQTYIDRIVSDLAIVDGWRVVADAANGAASKLAVNLFETLQCELTPLFCEFDGRFPNHDPDPSVAANLQTLIETVKETRADAGFAFDGDGDRLVVVTPKGRILWPDQLMMLFAQDIVARNPGCDVVYDIKSSMCLGELIAEHGGRPMMWKTGHSHIKAKMRETNALLGGEFSGHIFFKDRWFGFDDGMYAAARLLEIMTLTGQSLDQLLDDLPKRVATPEIKVPVKEEEKFGFIQKLIDEGDFGEGEMTTIDGVRVDYEDAWGLVRASNTAPALTLRFEAADEDKLDSIKNRFKKILQKINKDIPINF